MDIILLHAHVKYVCNDSANDQIVSTTTLRRVDLTVHALYRFTLKQLFKNNSKETKPKAVIYIPPTKGRGYIVSWADPVGVGVTLSCLHNNL